MRDAEHGKTGRLQGTDGGAELSFSPAGDWIGCVSAGELRKIPIDVGRSIVLASRMDVPFTGADWTTNGDVIFANRKELVHVHGNGGSILPIASFSEAAVRYGSPQMLPKVRACS